VYGILLKSTLLASPHLARLLKQGIQPNSNRDRAANSLQVQFLPWPNKRLALKQDNDCGERGFAGTYQQQSLP
jgi:hypothetical protein